MENTNLYQQDKKSGTHLHNNITSGRGTWFENYFKDAGALICTKGKRPSITIEGYRKRWSKDSVPYYVHFRKEFYIGDTVKIGMYNLIYTGEIVKIGPKTITTNNHGSIKRFKLAEFIDKNWNLDLDRICNHNAEEMYYI